MRAAAGGAAAAGAGAGAGPGPPTAASSLAMSAVTFAKKAELIHGEILRVWAVRLHDAMAARGVAPRLHASAGTIALDSCRHLLDAVDGARVLDQRRLRAFRSYALRLRTFQCCALRLRASH